MFQFSDVCQEFFLLLRGIEILVFSGAIPQVVSDVIVGIQAIGLVDALVQQTGYCLVIFVARKLFQFHQFHAGNRFADFYVYPTFGLGDSRQNTVQIFARFFGVFGKLAFVEFECFQNIARFPFVGNRYRYDVQLVYCLDFIIRARHAEHLDDALVCRVVSILGPAVALGYPDGLSFLLNHETDVVGQVSGTAIEFFQTSARAFYLKHLVAFANIDNQLVGHQIGTKGNLCGVEAVIEQEILEKTGV